MRFLDVEIQRTRHRIVTGRDGFHGRHDAVHGCDLKLVGVVLVEGQAEHAHAVLVRIDAGQRFGVVAVNVDRLAVGAKLVAGFLGSGFLFLVVSAFGGGKEQIISAGCLAAFDDHFGVEHFTRAVLGAGDENHDVLRGQSSVHFGPLGGRVVNQSAVLGNFACQRAVNVSRSQREGRASDVGCKHDAIIADADFHDFAHAIGGAQVKIALRNARRRVGDINGVLAHAFAQLLAASTRTAAFNNRRREIEVFAKGFGHDGGIGQHGRRTGDLNLVARRSSDGRGGKDRQRRSGKFGQGH
eukprot:Amastigsp_a511713_14.p2 type:complete len:298 gc:universal Amastigsp_a511713_14:239-1132(+)